MEKIFNFGALLKDHEKKHKNKPKQFVSVAGGVAKRLESNSKARKSSRLTIFDSLRNLPKFDTPVKAVSEAQKKIEHRKLQLEKWKEEKEKKKKEQASQKKKPFVAGIAQKPLKFVPPPPVTKPMPSSSGRVTRSQARNNAKKPDLKPAPKSSQSFAPKNASFKPPEIKNLVKLPTLVPVTKTKNDKKTFIQSFTFNPGPEATQTKTTGRQTRSRVQNKLSEPKPTQKTETRAPKAKIMKKLTPKKPVKTIVTSSSSSDMDNYTSTVRNITFSSSEDTKAIYSESSTDTLSKSPIKIDTPVVRRSSRKSFPGARSTPKNRIPKSESSSEERLRSPKSPMDLPNSPAVVVESSEGATKVSPCVTMSRGKDNARKEMKKKLAEGLLDEDVSDIDNVDYFRKQLASEIKRMTEMCEKWEQITEQNTLHETVMEAALSAVGNARLLMSQKLQQFASLVERCAQPEPGAALVTPADLHGFWDMVFMQIENVEMRFKKLGELYSGWEVPKVAVVETKKVIKQAVKKPAPQRHATSKLKEMIAAARRAKKDQQSPTSIPVESSEQKTFEAGFFIVSSPVRTPPSRSPAPSPAPSPALSPAKASLLKAVLSSEAKKASASKRKTSFAMLRASILCKNVELDGIAPLEGTPGTLPPVNVYATPMRSILKSTTKSCFHKSGKKSIKVVLFDQTDDEKRDNHGDNENNKEISEKTPEEYKEISEKTPEKFKEISEKTPDKYEEISEKTPEKSKETCEINADSGLSSMDMDRDKIDEEGKENSKRKTRLIRQDATENDLSPVMTRSRRKSVNAQSEDNQSQKRTGRRNSRRKSALRPLDSVNVIEGKTEETQTPKRSTRRKSSTKNVGTKVL